MLKTRTFLADDLPQKTSFWSNIAWAYYKTTIKRFVSVRDKIFVIYIIKLLQTSTASNIIWENMVYCHGDNFYRLCKIRKFWSILLVSRIDFFITYNLKWIRYIFKGIVVNFFYSRESVCWFSKVGATLYRKHSSAWTVNACAFALRMF